MIESSFSCSSSWDSEPFQELSEIPFLDYNLGSLERDCFQFDSFSSQNESSSHSSDYDSNSNFFDHIDKLLPIADSFISEILEDNYTGFQDEWSFLQDVENHSSPVQSTSSIARDSPKKGEKTNSFSRKSWSKMSAEEQLETLHSLSKIVTCHMGIKEQIKVIKIIDPTVTISPNDTEFQLDISRLNDAKLKRIQDLVRKHKYSLSSSKKLKSPSKLSQQKTSLTSKIFSGRTNPKTKRKQRKQKACAGEDNRQKRKLELHGQKEIQSGLFVYEKVIKLSNPQEDEDVNILE